MRKFIGELDAALNVRKVMLSACLSQSSELVVLLEDRKEVGKTIIVEGKVDEEYVNQNCFKIANKDEKEVVLFALDGCFVPDGKRLSPKYPKKCDCIFGYEGRVCFLEFKMNAESLHPTSIADNRSKACDQIEQTYSFVNDTLKLKGTSVSSNWNLVGYVCTPPLYPNKTTAMDDLMIGFLEKNGFEIFEVNGIEV